MKSCYWWLALFLQTASTLVRSNAKRCSDSGSSFAVLGVFDGQDTPSIDQFQTEVEDLDNFTREEPSCLPEVSHKELVLDDNMTVMQVINATESAFSAEQICYVVYASSSSNGQLSVQHAINRGIPVVSTLPEKEFNDRGERSTNFFDVAKVINLVKGSTVAEKVRVMLEFLFKENVKEFIVITDVDIDSMRIVSSLRELIGKRSLVLLDWFTIAHDDKVAEQIRRKMVGLPSHLTIVLITNDMDLASKIAVEVFPYYEVKILSDQDHDFVVSAYFEVPIKIIHPTSNGRLTRSNYVKDAITMLRVYLEEWAVYSPGRCPSSSEVYSFLQNVELSGETGRIRFNDERQRIQYSYQMSQKTPFQPAIPPKTTPIGTFDDGHFNKVADGAQRNVVKVTVVEYAPYVMIHPKITPSESCEAKNALPCYRRGPSGVDWEDGSCCNGFVVDVLGLVTRKICSTEVMCFDIKLIFNEDGVYGVQQDNGSWNGVVQDIITGKVEMAADLFPNSRRSEVLDFTDVYMPTGIALLVKETKRQQSKIYWTTYMRPFNTTLWYMFLGSVGVMIAFLWTIEKFAPSTTDVKLLHWSAGFRIDNAVCYVSQLAFGRPADDTKPNSNGARLTALTFGIAMMIVMASYSANLAAFLIVSDMTTPVDSIYDEKINSPPPGFKYGTVRGSYMADFFNNTDIEYFRKIWPAIQRDSVWSLAEGVNKVRSGELDVLIGDSVSLDYASLDDPDCLLKVVGDPFAMSGPSFAAKKGTGRAALVSSALRSLTGLETFIQKEWVTKYSCQKEVRPVQLPFKDLIGLFLQLLIAIALCILGTTCHVLWSRSNANHREYENKRGSDEHPSEATQEMRSPDDFRYYRETLL